VGDGKGEVGPVVGSIRGERDADVGKPLLGTGPSRLCLALRVVARRTRLTLPEYPSASSAAISLQSELLVPRSNISLALDSSRLSNVYSASAQGGLG
jgi:hypothetical protein